MSIELKHNFVGIETHDNSSPIMFVVDKEVEHCNIKIAYKFLLQSKKLIQLTELDIKADELLTINELSNNQITIYALNNEQKILIIHVKYRYDKESKTLHYKEIGRSIFETDDLDRYHYIKRMRFMNNIYQQTEEKTIRKLLRSTFDVLDTDYN